MKGNICKLAIGVTFAFIGAGCTSTSVTSENRNYEGVSEAKNVHFTGDNVWFVLPGDFKSNFERLADEAGYNAVIWDRRVSSCIWNQTTGFTIPREDPLEALAYYAKTQEFYLHFSELDMHVRAEYKGPHQLLRHCD